MKNIKKNLNIQQPCIFNIRVLVLENEFKNNGTTLTHTTHILMNETSKKKVKLEGNKKLLLALSGDRHKIAQ